MKRNASLSVDTIFSILIISVMTYLSSVSFSNIKQISGHIDDENDLLEFLEGLAEKENRKISLSSIDTLDIGEREENLDEYSIKIKRELLERNFGLVKSKITVSKDNIEEYIITYSVVGAE